MNAPANLLNLGLGTVQLGKPYGITNARGQVPHDEAVVILETAVASGIELFDTAAAYGESEQLLGEVLPSSEELRFVTKIMPGYRDRKAVISQLQRSLRTLQRDSVYGLLVHDAADLIARADLRSTLEDIKERGLVKGVGVSIYDAVDLEQVLEVFTPDIVQLPLNLLDQRFLRDGTIETLVSDGVEVHVRSIFAQGLLLSGPEQRSTVPRALAHAMGGVDAMISTAGLTRVELCLALASELPPSCTILVGVTTTDELDEIIACRTVRPVPGIEALGVEDPRWADPRTWVTT